MHAVWHICMLCGTSVRCVAHLAHHSVSVAFHAKFYSTVISVFKAHSHGGEKLLFSSSRHVTCMCVCV